MKRLILILILFLLYLPSLAWGTNYLPWVAASAGNTTDITRGFEADSDSSWTKTDTASILNRYDTGQAHSGTHSMSIAGTDTTIAYYTYDIGSNKTTISMCFWFYAPSTSLAYDNAPIAGIGQSVTDYAVRVYYRRYSNYYYFGFRGAAGISWGTYQVTTGAWYRVEIVTTQNDVSTMTVYNSAGTQVDQITRTAYNFPLRYIRVGRTVATSSTDWSTWYWDDIGADWTDATTPLWSFTVSN
jgi:hypothetical protein